MQNLCKKFYRNTCLAFLIFFLLTGPCAASTIAAVDLNSFYADPSVTVSPDGYSAAMGEDPFYSVVFLSNDPTLGDPGVAVPASLVSLSFEYAFVLAPNGDDELYARVFNGSNGALLNEWSVVVSQTGTVSWDLSGMDKAITLLGLEFQLRSWDLDIGSTAALSNVILTSEDFTPVPEPSSWMLFAMGVTGFVIWSSRPLKTKRMK